jgi:hypothetical protein
MSLSQKEKLLCNIHNSKETNYNYDKYSFLDVRPEDVLKTFSNSNEPSKRTVVMQTHGTLADELSQLSPIRNMKEQKNLVNEI